MPVSLKKSTQGRNRTLQATLSDFTASSASKTSPAKAMDSAKATASPAAKEPSDGSKDNAAEESGPMSAAILTAINDMKN